MASPPSLTLLTVTEAVDRFVESMHGEVATGSLADSTAATYSRDLAEFRRLDAAMSGGDRVLDEVSEGDIDRIMLAYGRTPDQRRNDGQAGGGRSPVTVRRFWTSLVRFFNHAAAEGWVQVSPMARARNRPRASTRSDNERRLALTVEQVQALLDHGAGPRPDGSERDPRRMLWLRDRFLLALMAFHGPRVSEVCAANRRSFTTSGGEVMWTIRGKGGKQRRIPVHPSVQVLMREYLESGRAAPSAALSTRDRQDAENALLLSWRGKRMTPRAVQDVMVRAHANVRAVDPDNARELTPHALRHTAATLLLAEPEGDVKVVQRLLGHASLATTTVYLDSLPGELANLLAHYPATLTAASESVDEA